MRVRVRVRRRGCGPVHARVRMRVDDMSRMMHTYNPNNCHSDQKHDTTHIYSFYYCREGTCRTTFFEFMRHSFMPCYANCGSCIPHHIMHPHDLRSLSIRTCPLSRDKTIQLTHEHSNRAPCCTHPLCSSHSITQNREDSTHLQKQSITSCLIGIKLLKLLCERPTHRIFQHSPSRSCPHPDGLAEALNHT